MTSDPKEPIEQTISPHYRLMVVLVCIFAIIISIILNITIKGDLFLQGLNFIYKYQTNSPSQFVKVMHNIVSLLGNPPLIIVFLGVFFLVSSRKLAVMVYLSYCLINIYVMTVFKQSFQQPRPFWYSNSIKLLQWNCQQTYGHPSGHSWISVFLYQPLITDFLGVGPGSLGLLLPLLSGIFIPLSRMYLGVHSSNQIIMGLLFSMISIVLYRYLFQRMLFHLFNTIMTPSKQKIPYLVGIVCSNIILFVIPIIFYKINTRNSNFPIAYIDRISIACKSKHTYLTIQSHILFSTASINIFFGFVYGSIMINKYLYADYFVGKWYYSSFLNVFLKLSLYIVVVGLPALIFILLLPMLISNDIVIYVMQTIGYLTVGILFVSAITILSIRFGLVRLQTKDNKIFDNELM